MQTSGINLKDFTYICGVFTTELSGPRARQQILHFVRRHLTAFSSSSTIGVEQEIGASDSYACPCCVVGIQMKLAVPTKEGWLQKWKVCFKFFCWIAIITYLYIFLDLYIQDGFFWLETLTVIIFSLPLQLCLDIVKGLFFPKKGFCCHPLKFCVICGVPGLGIT